MKPEKISNETIVNWGLKIFSEFGFESWDFIGH